MYLSAIENENLNGVYNAVAPNPVTNKELVLTLAKKMRGNFFIPIHVPAFCFKNRIGRNEY
jgi:NAD dependent epimerase/dehydratase family enzyme